MGASAAPGCWSDRAGWHRESEASEFPWLLILQCSQAWHTVPWLLLPTGWTLPAGVWGCC